MMRIVHALWDDDAVQGRPHHPDYIQRAADCVRQWVKPPLHPTIMHDRLDRSMRLLLDINGPRYVSVDNIRETSLRCVGYTYYTMAFAHELFVQVVLARSSINRTVGAMAEVAVSNGCKVYQLSK